MAIWTTTFQSSFCLQRKFHHSGAVSVEAYGPRQVGNHLLIIEIHLNMLLIRRHGVYLVTCRIVRALPIPLYLGLLIEKRNHQEKLLSFQEVG